MRIDIRDARLPGGRLTLSARTTKAAEFRSRVAAVRALMDWGALDLVAALRDRRLRITDVEAAHKRGGDGLVELRARLAAAVPTGTNRNGKAPADAKDSLSLGAQVDRLLTTVKATRSSGTHHQYSNFCRKLIARFGRDVSLSSIRSDALEKWIHEPKATAGNKPWANATQAVAMAVVGRLYNTAIAKEEEAADAEDRVSRIRRSPVKNVEMSSDRRARVEFLRPAEWRALSTKAAGRPVHVLLALGVLAGLRIGECANLRMEVDVILEGKPHIEVQSRAGAHPWATKTKRSVRRVPIGPQLEAAIRRHIELGYAGERYLIISQPDRDRPVARQVLAHWTAAAFKLAGIRYGRREDALTHHSLRHSFISWLVQADVSLKKIEKLAGTSVAMILEVYGHLIDEDLENAVLIVDRTGAGVEVA